MSSIPYTYQTPTPRFFFNTHFIDPMKENYTNRRKFLDWVLNNFYSVPWPRNGIHYEAYEFSFSIEKAAEEAGLTKKAFELQLNLYLENGWMTKRPNEIKNRSNIYRFEANKFSDKVVPIEKEKIEIQESYEQKQGATVLREENEKKGVTELKKGEPKREPRGEPIYERKDEKKGEPKEEPRGPFYRNKEAIESSLDNSDNISKSRACETQPIKKLSLSCKGKITAFFNPRTYRLRDGQPLSMRMQNAFGKYNPADWQKVVANVQFYEEYCDSGQSIRMGHERFLQWCINNNMASKKESSFKNDLLARVMKEEYKLNGMEILKTTIILRKPNGEEVSLDKELPHATFTHILDNYINFYKESRHAT